MVGGVEGFAGEAEGSVMVQRIGNLSTASMERYGSDASDSGGLCRQISFPSLGTATKLCESAGAVQWYHNYVLMQAEPRWQLSKENEACLGKQE